MNSAVSISPNRASVTVALRLRVAELVEVVGARYSSADVH